MKYNDIIRSVVRDIDNIKTDLCNGNIESNNAIMQLNKSLLIFYNIKDKISVDRADCNKIMLQHQDVNYAISKKNRDMDILLSGLGKLVENVCVDTGEQSVYIEDYDMLSPGELLENVIKKPRD